ncbi:SurA N-terminal domain-containing protein [Paraburkholderia hayleyella]|uniref:SurA N-terminal domain-containing protein n=1 Tax=Paraburkholderia hayleyella TaxID=2152889 RepID=UPI001290E084|nr:SurA N-terminal domain-containing protein [Paraburkholderia hayleyella]
MLDFFRNHKRLMMFMLILVIVPGLGFVGIQGFRGFFDDSGNVAQVNGYKITRAEYDNSMRQQLDRARQMLGAQFDLKTFNTPEHRQQVLDAMVMQRVLADETLRLHLTASDAAVRRALLSDPFIASLKNPDGSIDLERYKQVLAAQGMTPEQYDASVRYSLAQQQLPSSIQSSAFTSKTLAQHLIELAEQQREVQSLMFRASDYLAKVQPTEAQLQAYYDAHRADFATPATATIQYLVLSPEVLAASVQPTEADLKKYYDDNLARFRTPGEVRASHILIAAAKDASAADKEKARQQAEKVLAELKAHPGQFAQIAEKQSQDPGSAAKGGDLGYFGRGMIAGGKAFDDAAFSLKKDEISGIVQSDFGYHIIKVTEVKPPVTQPFAEVKGAIAHDLKTQHAAKRFTDSADSFTSMVYEQAKSLQPAADKFKLPLQTAVVTPKPNAALAATSPLNNPQFLEAIFSDDAVKNRNNIQAIDLGNNTLISARVSDFKAAAIPSFAALKDSVRQKVITQQAAELAAKDGAARLAVLQKSQATTGFAPALKVSRNNPQGLPETSMSAIYKASAEHLPVYTGVDLGAQGYVIYRVNAVLPGAAMTPERLTAAQQQVAQVHAQSELEAYLDALRQRAKVKHFGSLEAAAANAGQ